MGESHIDSKLIKVKVKQSEESKIMNTHDLMMLVLLLTPGLLLSIVILVTFAAGG